MTEVPVVLLTIPEGPPPYSPNFLAGVALDAQVPGINAHIKVTFADAFAGDMSAIASELSIFPDTALLHIELGALPLPPGASDRYRTVTLPLAFQGAPAPVELPVIWDPQFQTDFLQAAANIKTFLVAQGVLSRVFAVGFCSNQRGVNDGEFTIPSTNPAPYSDDFSAAWIGGTDSQGTVWPGVNYSEQAVIDANNAIAVGFANAFPGTYIQFAFLSAGTQKLGFTPDPGSAFASEILNGMVNAAAAVGGLVTPIQQSLTTSTKLSNFAIAQGRSIGRLFVQLVPAYTTPDQITAGMAAALAIGVDEIQIHHGQSTTVRAFLDNLDDSTLVSFAGGTLPAFAQGQVTYAAPQPE